MIVFESRAFPTVPGEHPDDPTLLGLPLMRWLQGALTDAGAVFEDGDPQPYDAGWVVKLSFDDRRFAIGCHAVASERDGGLGEYNLLVQTVPRFMEFITGGVDVAVDDKLILLIEQLLVDAGIATKPTVLIDG